MLNAIDTLVRKRQRRFLRDAEKEELIQRQKHCCQLCHDSISRAEAVYDHKIPLHTMEKDQSIEAFQALCAQCHFNKTQQETRPVVNRLESIFNPKMQKMYLEAAKPACQVWGPSTVDFSLPAARPAVQVRTHMAVDVCSCRKLALYTAKELPVFSCLDDPLPVDPAQPLPDLIFVDTGAPAPKDVDEHAAALPYCGSGWYMKPSVEYLMHCNRVRWDDLKLGVTASGHLPGARMREVMDLIDSCWTDVYEAGESVDHNGEPHKFAWNSIIGIWGMNEQTQLKTWLSFQTGPANNVFVAQNAYQVDGLYELSRVTTLTDSASYRPLYEYALNVEHVRVAEALQAVNAVHKTVRQSLKILCLCTDGFIFPKLRNTVTCDKLKQLLETLSFTCLINLEDRIREELHQAPPKQKRLRTDDLYPKSSLSPCDKKVFRMVVPWSNSFRVGDYQLARLLRNCTVVNDEMKWTCLSQADATERILNGGNIFITGPAGVGKSTYTLKCVEELRAAGKRVMPISKTHVSSGVIDGQTADSFAYRYVREGGCGADVIYVDELSMLNIQLLHDILHLSLRDPPPQFILSGDFSQYSPAFDFFMGEPVAKGFETSSLLHSLAQGTKFVMTQCRRSDAALFEAYTSIIENGCRFQTPLSECVAYFRSRYTSDKVEGFICEGYAPTNLVLSHRLRIQINERCNQALAAAQLEKVKFTLEDYDMTPDSKTNAPQQGFFWKGQEVIAASTKAKYKNGIKYTIVSISSKNVELTGGDTNFTLSAEDFFRNFRMTFALCYAAIQGTTIKTLLALWDCDHKYFTRQHLYVGSSRASASNLLVVM